MSDSTTNTIVAFCENFTSKKFFSLLVILALLTGIFWLFESTTSHFAGLRTAQQIDSMEKLVKMRSQYSLTPEEEKIRQSLLSDITTIGSQDLVKTQAPHDTAPQAAPPVVPPNYGSLYKFAAALIPWGILALAFVVFNPRADKWMGALGMASIGLISSIAAVLFKSISFWTVHFWVPFGICLSVLMLIGTLGVFFDKTRKKNLTNENTEK